MRWNDGGVYSAVEEFLGWASAERSAVFLDARIAVHCRAHSSITSLFTCVSSVERRGGQCQGNQEAAALDKQKRDEADLDRCPAVRKHRDRMAAEFREEK